MNKIKKNLLFATIYLLSQQFVFSQTLSYYNPYVDYSGHALLFTSNTQYRAKNYDGEYQLFFNNHPWQLWNSGQYARSYKIETVSFPFIPDEVISTSTIRQLSLPDPLTYNGVDRWQTALSTLISPIYRIYSNEDEMANPMCNYYTSSSINSIGDLNNDNPSSLASTIFEWQFPQNIDDRIFYPHSVLKHTLYIHCGPLQSSPIIDKLEFIIDFTRGVLRKYPFVSQNFDGGSADKHDLTVFPILVLDNNDYDESTLSTDDYDPYYNYIPIDAINYFPISESF